MVFFMEWVIIGVLNNYFKGAPSLSAILEVSLGEASTFIDSFLGKVRKLYRVII